MSKKPTENDEENEKPEETTENSEKPETELSEDNKTYVDRIRPLFQSGKVLTGKDVRDAIPEISRSQSFKIINILKKEKTANVEFEFEPVEPFVTVEKGAEAPTVTPKAKAKAEEGMKLEQEIAKVLAKGMLTKDQLTAVFSMVNELILNGYHSKESCALMAGVWFAPINRLMAKYSQENVDLYIAIIISVMWFATPMKERIKSLFHRKDKNAKTGNQKEAPQH